MQLKLGILLIIAALPAAMFVPIKYGGYLIVVCCLIAAVTFVVTAPPLPGWPEDEEVDDDTAFPEASTRPSRRLRRAEQKLRYSSHAGHEGDEEDDSSPSPVPPAA